MYLGAYWSLLVDILEALVAILRPLGPSGGHQGPIWVPFWYHFVALGFYFDIIFDIFQTSRARGPFGCILLPFYAVGIRFDIKLYFRVVVCVPLYIFLLHVDQ